MVQGRRQNFISEGAGPYLLALKLLEEDEPTHAVRLPSEKL